MKGKMILLFLLVSIGTVEAKNRIDKIMTNEGCLLYVDSLLQVYRNELSYFNTVPLKEVTDEDFLIPELRNYISSNSLIGWEKFDLNQDGNMDLYFSISDKYYQPIQGFVIGNGGKNSDRIYLFDQFGVNTFENTIFQVQEKTSKKNQLFNYRYTASEPDSCAKVICTRLMFINNVGFLEVPQNNKLINFNKLNYVIIKYYSEFNQSKETIVDFKKRILETKNGDINISKKLTKDEINRIRIISQYSFSNIDLCLVPCKRIFSHTKTTVYNLYLTNKNKIEIRDESNGYGQAVLLLKKTVERISTTEN
jgi:hypothetical protein